MTEVTVHRRKRAPQEIAADAYRPLLKRLEARVAKDRAQLEKSETAAEVVRQKIAMQNQLPLPETTYVYRDDYGNLRPLPSDIDTSAIGTEATPITAEDIRMALAETDDTKTVCVVTGPLQDIPLGKTMTGKEVTPQDIAKAPAVRQADVSAPLTHATDSVGAETTQKNGEFDAVGARERVVAKRAVRVTGKCSHGKLAGWCSHGKLAGWCSHEGCPNNVRV